MSRDSNVHSVQILAAGASTLATTAAAMSPGTWAALTTTGLNAAILQGGSTGNMIPFQNNGCWDGVRGKAHIVGQDHGWAGLRHITYDEASNSWVTTSANIGTSAHGYDHLNCDVTTGDLYLWGYYYGAGGPISRFAYSSQTWTINYGTRNFHTNVASGTCIWTGSLSGFSDPKGVLCAVEGDFGTWAGKGVSSLGSAGNFTQFADLALTAPGYHLLAAYNPTSNVAVFGGGNNQPKRIWRMDSALTVTELTTAPAGVNVGIQQGSLSEDPTTGNFLIMTGGQLWELNPTGSGTYTQQTGTRVPPAAVNTFEATSNAACVIPISTYGVTMVVSADGASSANVYLYKHA